jgi:hypothetical protein
MSLVGPDGKPLTDLPFSAPVIGQAKSLADLDPFTPEELVGIALPLEEALAAGVPLNMPSQVDTLVMFRLVATVLHLSAKLAVDVESVEVEDEAEEAGEE